MAVLHFKTGREHDQSLKSDSLLYAIQHALEIAEEAREVVTAGFGTEDVVITRGMEILSEPVEARCTNRLF